MVVLFDVMYLARGITDVLKTLKKTIADLKLFFFITLSDWMSIIGSHSIFSVYYLMDAYNLCIWSFWSPAVYLGDSFLWLWIKILLLINNLKKKKSLWFSEQGHHMVCIPRRLKCKIHPLCFTKIHFNPLTLLSFISFL